MERATSFEAMATLGTDIAALTDRGEALLVTGLRSAGSLHEVLAAPPLFGRTDSKLLFSDLAPSAVARTRGLDRRWQGAARRSRSRALRGRLE
jgi:hypothetical protein